MPNIRDEINGPVSLDYFAQRTAQGWKLKAVEWEHTSKSSETAATPREVPSPYGLAVSPPTAHLETQPSEVEVLQTILELIVVEKGISHIAAELNRRGFTTRNGLPWTSTAVFNLLPRLIETAPEILKAEGWQLRRKKAVS